MTLKKNNVYKTIDYLLKDSIKLRLRSDVDVGACLSGGLDSSIIVGICSKVFKKKLHTFSSIYKKSGFDEEKYIDDVNSFADTCNHKIFPESEINDLLDYIRVINYYHDGPSSSASLYSQYFVMRNACNEVRVLLDGQGADELFCGYLPYYNDKISDLLRKNTFITKLKAVRLLAAYDCFWKDLTRYIRHDDIILYLGSKFSYYLRKIWSIKEYKTENNIFTKSFLDDVNTTIEYKNKKYKFNSMLDSSLCKDLVRDGIPHLVHNEDRNSMMFSIETRLPFLDYRIVEFALGLDGKYKIRGCKTKYILRKTFKKYLPRSVRVRKDKMGFPAPFSDWILIDKINKKASDVVFSFSDRNILNKDYIKRIWKEHLTGEYNHGDILYRIISMELFLRDNKMRYDYDI